MRMLAILAIGAAALFAQAPKTANEWEQLGLKQHSEGHYREAIESFQKALDAGFPRAGRYNLACALARAGEADRAMEVLKTMIENGAILPIATDNDLDTLRSRADFAALLSRARLNAEPCTDAQRHPEYRQFDFWLGEWNVFDPAGRKVGESRIELILKSCTIVENWTGTGGGSGKSFNQYNPALHKWQQYWVADTGNTTYFVGEAAPGEMRYIADAKANGMTFDRRLTFTRLDGGKVRQHSERQAGDAWVTEYDFTYVPKPRP